MGLAHMPSRSVSKSDLLFWAHDKLPSLKRLLSFCSDDMLWCEPGSFNAKLAHVSKLLLEADVGLKEHLESEMKSIAGAVFLKQVAAKVFNCDLEAASICPELIAMIPTDCSPNLPPSVTDVAPPLAGHVFVSVFRVKSGGRGALNLSKLLAPAMKLWRRAHWPEKHFRLAAMSNRNALSLERVLARPKVVEVLCLV